MYYRCGSICYLFTTLGNSLYTHITWHVHASKTFIWELAHKTNVIAAVLNVIQPIWMTIHYKWSAQKHIPGELEPMEHIFIEDKDFVIG